MMDEKLLFEFLEEMDQYRNNLLDLVATLNRTTAVQRDRGWKNIFKRKKDQAEGCLPQKLIEKSEKDWDEKELKEELDCDSIWS